MQLDIFEHSRDVGLRNAVIDALWDRDDSKVSSAIANLAVEYPGDSTLPAFALLHDRLSQRAIGSLDRVSAGTIVRAIEESIPAAQRIFGSEAEKWLAPLWTELAIAASDLAFDSREENLHAASFLLRAAKWTNAIAAVETIPSWRRQPTPLAWKIEAMSRTEGVDSLWPLIAELSWMAPRRMASLVDRMQIAELSKLVRTFHVEFDGDGTASDFAWFPAWALIAAPHLADRIRAAQNGADTPPERCARLVLSLLALERQGRHAALIENRKRLRDVHRALFDRYMQSRPASLSRQGLA